MLLDAVFEMDTIKIGMNELGLTAEFPKAISTAAQLQDGGFSAKRVMQAYGFNNFEELRQGKLKAIKDLINVGFSAEVFKGLSTAKG